VEKPQRIVVYCFCSPIFNQKLDDFLIALEDLEGDFGFFFQKLDQALQILAFENIKKCFQNHQIIRSVQNT
jgi:hypothetical protein